MLLQPDMALLKVFLENSEDCSQLSDDEYIADLYDVDNPLTLDIILTDQGAAIEAAARLIYDSEQDGWYMGEQVEDEAEILAALNLTLAAFKANG